MQCPSDAIEVLCLMLSCFSEGGEVDVESLFNLPFCSSWFAGRQRKMYNHNGVR
jgi:hypothetical protein